jgi:NAD(P)-dependent dehydrogenase (short-subunit alcohol dehydrogenase family)
MLMVRPFLDEKETNEMLRSQSPWPNLGTPEDVAKAVLVLASTVIILIASNRRCR